MTDRLDEIRARNGRGVWRSEDIPTLINALDAALAESATIATACNENGLAASQNLRRAEAAEAETERLREAVQKYKDACDGKDPASREQLEAIKQQLREMGIGYEIDWTTWNKTYDAEIEIKDEIRFFGESKLSEGSALVAAVAELQEGKEKNDKARN